MAGHPPRSPLTDLPAELIVYIISYLDPYDVTRLQVVSRRLRDCCLDDSLWKQHCFDSSHWLHTLTRRRLQEAELNASNAGRVGITPQSPQADHVAPAPRNLQRRRDIANWDPAYPAEKVRWYDEYIQRNGPACINWLETPSIRDGGIESMIEARGMALYTPYNGDGGRGTQLAVSPLDDGSVCLWDVKGNLGKRGAIHARSKPGILFIGGPGNHNSWRSKRIDTGVTECVSVDNESHRAYFAVQSHLIVVDLQILEVVTRDSFEWSIATLSPVDMAVPMTVGTSLGIHLYDFRASTRRSPGSSNRLEGWSTTEQDIMSIIFDPRPLPLYAPLSQPTPTSIVHLPQGPWSTSVTEDIYVSGRFSNILHYDRRNFPAIVGSIYSGSMVNNSMAVLPYPVRQQGKCAVSEVMTKYSNEKHWTLVAGGLYKSKGSLEIYGLGPSSSGVSTVKQTSSFSNRQSAASSSILSVVNHGTKIVFCDAGGLLRWFERDGETLVRSLKVRHSDVAQKGSIFANMLGADDMARKILSTRPRDEASSECPNNDNILLWTGEKLGLVSFTSTPLFRGSDFRAQSHDATSDEEDEHMYTDRMREALERQADEARFMGRLDFGVAPTSR